MAALSPALASAAVLSLIALLILLLALTLVTVIRLPPWTGSPAAEETLDEEGIMDEEHTPDKAGQREPKHARPAPPPPLPRRAPGQSGRVAYPAGDALGALDVIRPPRVSGCPPWEPAPTPSGKSWPR